MVGYFEEAEGQKGSTRLNSFLLLLFFFAFNIIALFKSPEGQAFINGDLLLFDLMLLVGVFAPKYLHKVAELKFGTPPKP